MLSKILPESPNGYLLREKEFSAELEDVSKWIKIPLLNYMPSHKLRDKSLVRFRGMVQDMQNPEIYLERYEVNGLNGSKRMQEGKYSDCLVLNENETVNFESDRNVQGERRTLFVVSIPGLNDWVKKYEEKCTIEHSQQIGSQPSGQANETNRCCTENHVNANNGDRIEENETNLQQSTENICQSDSVPLDPVYLVNSPIPESSGKACMVKIYSNFELYSLNTIVDVVGFLSIDPALAAKPKMLSAFENFNQVYAQNPPPSLIPRLHAIALHTLPHPNPLLDRRLQLITRYESSDDLNIIAVYKDLRKLLTLCVFNDDLAAEYLLCHLISTVYNRINFESAGKFCLNLCGIPENVFSSYTRKFYEIIQMLVPASHYLALSLDKMNTTSFVPKKDYETDKLVSGILQLAPQTHLVLDETQLQQGKLEENGVRGIQCLAHLIKQQQIKCDFHYYEIEYNTDIPVLILSEGKSILPSDFLLPLQPCEEMGQNIEEMLKIANNYLQTDRLDKFRRFLTIAKICDFAINPESMEMIQADFVKMRKSNSASNSDDLHSLLVLSRLLAIAQGKKALDEESWNLAKEMEVSRLQRIKKLSISNRKIM